MDKDAPEVAAVKAKTEALTKAAMTIGEAMYKASQAENAKKQAEDAQNAVENELKTQEQLMSKINALDAETEKIDNLKSKD